MESSYVKKVLKVVSINFICCNAFASQVDLLSQATFENTHFNIEQQKLDWSQLIGQECNSINATSITDVESDLILNVDICDDIIEFGINTKLSSISKDITCKVNISDQWFNFTADPGYTHLFRYQKAGIHRKIVGYCITMLH